MVMAGVMSMKDIQGQATLDGHKDWILIESYSMPMYRKIEVGARDNQRFQGDTVAGDIVVVRTIDKSSPKIAQGMADGTCYAEVVLHFTTQANNKQEVYLEIKLKNVLITSYNVHVPAEQRGSEEITFNYTGIEWTLFTLDSNDAKGKGKVVAKYDLGAGKG
jgi:type VI secretion system secreted protein Hcp